MQEQLLPFYKDSSTSRTHICIQLLVPIMSTADSKLGIQMQDQEDDNREKGGQ